MKAIELGRKANLRSYNDYRELFRFPRVTDWSQITGNEKIQQDAAETVQVGRSVWNSLWGCSPRTSARTPRSRR